MVRDRVLVQDLLAIALLSLGALSIEIGLTRILSLVEWYHFAFMVVSIALFGYAVGGSVLALIPSIVRNRSAIPVASAGACISGILSIFFAVLLRFDPIRANAQPLHALVIVLQYLALGLPFLFTGICLACLITRRPGQANLVYFADLVGAGVGCIFALSMMALGGPHLAILGSAAFCAMACGLFSRSEGLILQSHLAFAGTLALGFLLVLQPGFDPAISEYKALSAALRYPDARLVWSDWNAVSRIDAVSSRLIHYAPGMAFDSPERVPEQIGLTVDGDNLEPVTSFDGNLSTLGFLETLPSRIPYVVGPRKNVLIVDSGGGFDVLSALWSGAAEVVALERNPSIVEAVKHRFAEFSGNLYSRADVEIHAVDPRCYLASSEESFDLIEISLKQDPVTASVGLYSLSESYLFTVESFRQFLAHLSPEGVLVVTRWLGPPPRQSARIASMMVAALESEGVADASLHLASFRTYLTVTTMMKKTSFEAAELASIRQTCEKRRYDLVFLPGISANETNRFNKFQIDEYYEAFRRIVDSRERRDFYHAYLFDLTPPTDERPFFFDFMKWDRVLELRRSLGKLWNPFLEGGLLVVAVLIQAGVASLILIGLPLLVASRRRERVPRMGRWVAYFILLGAGYMLVEVTYLQKFILFLGQPAYAMSAVLFSMLVFSGLGSLWSRKSEPTPRIVGVAVLAVGLLVLVQALWLGWLIRSFLGWHIWAKFAIAVGLIGPLAFAMGMPFPTGLRMLGRRTQSAIPLAYCANGCSSVVGSAGTIVLGSLTGFSNVLAISAFVYFAAYLVLPASRSPP